jgi:hypothetical protein
MTSLQSKDDVLSALEDVSRQICAECTSADTSRTLRQHTKQLRADMAAILLQLEGQVSKLHRAAGTQRDFCNDLRRAVDILRRKEMSIVSHHLSVDVDSVDSEISQLATMRKQVDMVLDSITDRVDEQKQIYLELEEAIPADIDREIQELESIKLSIKVWAVLLVRWLLLLFN